MFERACSRPSVLAALLFVVLSGAVRAAATADANASLAAPYASEASKQTVVEVLHRFAADHGLTLQAGNGAHNAWQTAKLDGWVRAPTGRAFLEQLAQAHHFSWFIAERTLYVSTTRDSAVERIALNGARADAARAALESVGLYDARFGWGALSGQDAVLVGGPRAYRALVRRFLAGEARPSEGGANPAPLVFPLRFAQAADAPASGRGAEAAPRHGVAALLRQLLTREVPAASPAFALPTQADFPPLPPATPPFAQWLGLPGASSSTLAPVTAAAPRARARQSLPGTASAGSTQWDASEIGIVADERTNSVIVWADRRWRNRIQPLIDALDRPSSLVAMDVLVIEADVATVAALNAASDSAHAPAAPHRSAFDEQIDAGIAQQRVRLLNRQTLVGQLNSHTTLAIGGEITHTGTTSDLPGTEPMNGRGGHRGDRLDLAARIVPSEHTHTTSIAVDVDLLMAQPTGLPGQPWTHTSSVKLDTAVTLDSGAPPRLIASYPVASARAQQRAIFISAKAL